MSERDSYQIAVLADDLIWASRLVAAVERAGAQAVRANAAASGGRQEVIARADAALIDLNGRSYDGVSAVGEAAASGRPVIAVGQHEDVDLRRRALAAGAGQVYSYNRFFREGPKLLSRLVDAAAEPAR